MTREEQIIKIGAQFAIDETDGQTSGRAASMRGVLLSAFRAGAHWADSYPNWISVEERLPEVGEKVIFYSPGIDDWLSGAFQQDGTWWNEEYGTHFYGVTHWMEIVPPRKEE